MVVTEEILDLWEPLPPEAVVVATPQIPMVEMALLVELLLLLFKD
jgi:hypothetical protein